MLAGGLQSTLPTLALVHEPLWDVGNVQILIQGVWGPHRVRMSLVMMLVLPHKRTLSSETSSNLLQDVMVDSRTLASNSQQCQP